MRQFADTYSQLLIGQEALGQLNKEEFLQDINNKVSSKEIGQALLGQLENIFFSPEAKVILNITWYHNITLLDKVKDQAKRLWYAQQTIEHGWSRSVLVHQIESNLYSRQAIQQIKTHNFNKTLPEEQSDLAQKMLKQEYDFSLIDTAGAVKERGLEKALIDDIIKFLTELGKGFAFVGKQYHIEAGGDDYYIDLLFFHLKLRSYIVIELKTTKFKPEYAGKMAFYLARIDKTLKTKHDNDSIGIILCKDENKEVRDEVIQYITKPIGVAGYQLAECKKEVPEELKEIEELKKLMK